MEINHPLAHIDRSALWTRLDSLFREKTKKTNVTELGPLTLTRSWIHSAPQMTLDIRTHREWSGGEECDGTEYPNEEADAIAKAVAEEFNLEMDGYSTCEKAWGWYTFKKKAA